MKTNKLFWPMNLAAAALLLALARVIIMTGCGSTANGDGSAHEHSTDQGSCH